jgi:hypothetical protein
MKKTFTLLFFVGVLTSAFAQSHGHEQYDNQNSNNKYQPSGNSGDNNYSHAVAYPGNDSYNKNYQQDTRNNEHGYSYNDKGNWSRDDMWKDHNRYPEYGNQRRMDDYSYRSHRRGAWFEVMFSRHSTH